MLARLGRPNYVTPTNYLELVKGYCKLLKEKRTSVGDQAFKLKNGLQKLSDTAEQVAEMSIELEQKKKVVARAQTECEEMLVVIVQEKRVVDEQQKQVNLESEKIAKDEVETRRIAEDAQADLDKAMPALETAQKVCGQPCVDVHIASTPSQSEVSVLARRQICVGARTAEQEGHGGSEGASARRREIQGCF